MLQNPVKSRIRFRCSAITRFGVLAALLGLPASEPAAQGQSVGPDAVASFGRRGSVLPHREQMRVRELRRLRSDSRTVTGDDIATRRHSAGGGRCYFE
jgi:hypothetical protein